MLVKILNKFNCQSFPIDETAIDVDEEILDKIGIDYCFDVEKNRVIKYDNSEDLKQQKKDELRFRRIRLLEAFDKYKSNIAYGLFKESEEQFKQIKEWYFSLLELEDKAFENIPEPIKKYI